MPKVNVPAVKTETITAGYGFEPKPREICRTEDVNFRTAVRFKFQIFRTETATELPVPDDSEPPINRVSRFHIANAKINLNIVNPYIKTIFHCGNNFIILFPILLINTVFYV